MIKVKSIWRGFLFFHLELLISQKLLLAVSFFLLSFTIQPIFAEPASNKKKTSPKKIEAFLREMSDEEKIAQLFVISFYSQKNYNQILKVFVPSGVVDYRNIQSNKAFYKYWFKGIDELQETSLQRTKLPVLYMVNQEGGTVSRFKRDFFYREKPEYSNWDVPSPLKMVHANDLKKVEALAGEIGKLLLILGINMNLAPVVDTMSEKRNDFVRWRSFSTDPYQVQKLSRAFTAGLQKVGVIATFKHFPGFTNSRLDPHVNLVTIPLTEKEFREKYWIPYQFQSIWAYPKVVMSNIALYPELDNQSTAPLSKKIITGYLKQELGYKGLILTDDIGMLGYKEKDKSERAIRSLLAGHDMIIHSIGGVSDMIQVYKDVLKAFKEGRIPRSQVDASLRKILKLKFELSHKKTPLETRALQIEESWKKLFYISKELTQSMVSSFFKKNPHLKQSLSKDITVISFSEESYQEIEALGYFKNHQKELDYFRAMDRIRYPLPNDKPKTLIQKPDFRFSDKRIGFCYGKVASYCHQYLSREEKKYVVVIDTSLKPLLPNMRKQYKLYIPAQGAFPKVGEMFLKPMLQP